MITLKVTDLQYEVIKAAMQSYYIDMVRSLAPMEPDLTISVSEAQPPANSPLPWDDEAPYGRKLDGTPKKRPGRRARKARKGRA